MNWNYHRPGRADGPGPDGVSPVIAIIIMVAVCVILCGVLYVWVSSLASTSDETAAAYEKGIEKQQAPADPVSMVIESTLDVDYLLFRNEVLTTYKLDYSASFVYAAEPSARSTSIPLPEGSMEGLVVTLNSHKISRPKITGNKIIMSLPAGQDNTITIGYSSLGKDGYEHGIPKNKLLDRFAMTIVIKGADYELNRHMVEDSLLPDRVNSEGGEVRLVWDKSNTILREDISVYIPKLANPFANYLYLMPCLLILLVVIAAAQYEAFKRLRHKWRTEYLVFIAAPGVLLYMILGIALVYLPPIASVSLALVLLAGMLALVQKKVFGLKKGFLDNLLFPWTSVASVTILVFFPEVLGVIMSVMLLIVVILVVLNFIRRFKRPRVKEDASENIGDRLLQLEGLKKNLEQKVEELSSQNQILKEMENKKKIDRRYCHFCGEGVKNTFGFCPGCGSDIRNTYQCPTCTVLLTGKEKFCPNCRTAFEGVRLGRPV